MKPYDYIALGFAATICFILIGVFYQEWSRGEELSIERVYVISGIMGGMISIIAHYFGNRGKDDD